MKHDIAVINAHTDFIFQESVRSSLDRSVCMVIDTEHNKIVGAIRTTYPPQQGNYLEWNDDVYVVEAVRFQTEEKGEEKGEEKAGESTRRGVNVQLSVRFVGKRRSTP